MNQITQLSWELQIEVKNTSSYTWLKWILLAVCGVCASVLIATGVYMRISLVEQQNAVQRRQAAIAQLELSVQKENDVISEFITEYSVVDMATARRSLEEYLSNQGYTYDSFMVYPLSAGKDSTYLVILEWVDSFSIPRQFVITCALGPSGSSSVFKEYALVP